MNRKKAYLPLLIILPCGVLLNFALSNLCLKLGLPLFLDCYGTIMATLLAGSLPGIIVGFMLNLINGMSDPITLYYAILSVLIAFATGKLAEKGYFDRIRKCILPILVLAFIGGALGSVLTWLLYGGGIGSGISAPYAIALYNLGLPEFFAQLIADIGIDLVDKAIMVLSAVLTIKLIPRRAFAFLPYALVDKADPSEKSVHHRDYRLRSLRTKVISIIIINSFVLGGIAIAIGNYLYLPVAAEKYTDSVTGIVDTALLSTDKMIFNIKMAALLFGAASIIVMAVLLYCDAKIVAPINAMTRITEDLAYDDPVRKEEGNHLLSSTTIETGDEIENLFRSLFKMSHETDEYIKKIKEDSEYISRLQSGIILSFADMVESRDENTGEHIKHTASYVQIIAETLVHTDHYTDILTKEYIHELIRSAPLHDIGKIKIPDAILNKPGKLTVEEYDLMKTHTLEGKNILDRICDNVGESNTLSIAAEMAAYHHEWWNGSGYPEKRVGDAIPLSARIMAIADVFDALVSKRSYKGPFAFDHAVSIIKEESGTHFDPVIVDAFLASLDRIAAVKEQFVC